MAATVTIDLISHSIIVQALYTYSVYSFELLHSYYHYMDQHADGHKAAPLYRYTDECLAV